MYIQKTLSFTHFFKAHFKCEKCGAIQEAQGVVDKYFENVVLPNALCPVCGLNSYGENAEKLVEKKGRTFVLS